MELRITVKDPKGTRERELLEAKVAKQNATIEYLAMMADIEIPVEEAEGGTEVIVNE